jgi:hypothetical protein
MTTPTPALLGYLAQFSSFSTQSEVLCTQGLTYLLKTYPQARSALADEVMARTGIGIGDSLTWHAEAQQEDGGIPDLEARTRTADKVVPVVKIEAKLGAELGAGQLQSYVADLRKRNSGEAAMLVLVPEVRVAEVAEVTAKAFGKSGSGPWRVTDGHLSGIAVISVISWDELFTALRSGKAERFRYELEQLQAMYRELSSDFIAPLASIEDLHRWRARETDFLNVVDKVTRRLTTQHQTYPMGLESLEDASHEHEDRGYRRRYVCRFVGDAESCFSIGVRDSFAEWVTPVWMRFRSDTGNFGRIRQRIEASSLKCLESGGHIWIPLDVPLDVSGKQMIQALVEQAEEVLRVTYPAE